MPGKRPPPAHTPLAALPAVVLDLETTGLDVRTDRVVQIGAIAMLGANAQDPRMDQLVNPTVPIPATATRIHGLDDDCVANAPTIAGCLPRLATMLEGSVVVGHHIGFDMGVLRHEAARVGAEWPEPPTLDVAMLASALDATLPDVGLETIAARLGVTIDGRHSAMGDCEATARIFARLLPLLREADVRTLGEARALAAQRHELTLRQTQAGWDRIPAELRVMTHTPPRLMVDGHAFQHRLCDVMSTPPLFTDGNAMARDAARLMVEHGIAALLVGAPDRPPAGIVTERDLLRLTAQDPRAMDTTPVSEVMSRPVASLGAAEMLYRALGRMDRLGIRHLCVADDDGIPVGMVSQRDLLAHRARSTAVIGDALAAARNEVDLAAAYGQLPGVARALVAEGLSGVDVARVISTELRELTARAAELSAAELESGGAGPAPARWCVLVLGSGGRGESLLGADQDNAIIHDGHDTDDSWFQALGEKTADMLHVAGVPRCKGGVMAANALWRGTCEGWRERIGEWLTRARPEDLLNLDIFFDLMPSAGEAQLAQALHRDAVAAASRALPFIGLMSSAVQALAPRLSLLGRLPAEQGRVDLKRDGLLPLVSLARTLALRIGSSARSTPTRLLEAAAAGRLAAGDANMLVALHDELLTLVLEQQLRDTDVGIAPSPRVAVGEIERSRMRELTRGLRNLGKILDDLRAAVAG